MVVPAFNAADTLPRTLESLRAQTFDGWEAIVVDDGSADTTLEIATDLAAQDARIRVLSQAHAGAGVARNRGIAATAGDWLLFLDADDWVAPEMLERLLARAAQIDAPAWIVCGYSTVAPDGTVLFRGEGRVPDDLVGELSRTCPFTIHCCLVRRPEIVAVGGFDPTLRTCEDWDLWRRLALRGVPIAAVPDSMAYYGRRDDSLSTDFAQLLADGWRVILRSEKEPPVAARSAAAVHLFWCGGALVAQQRDVSAALAPCAPLARTPLEPGDLARAFYRGARDGTHKVRADWPALLQAMAPRLERELARLVEFCRGRDLAAAVRRELEAYAVEYAAGPGPTELGRTWVLDLEPADLPAHLDPPPGVEQIALRISGAGSSGVVWLPALGRRLSGQEIADRLEAQLGRAAAVTTEAADPGPAVPRQRGRRWFERWRRRPTANAARPASVRPAAEAPGDLTILLYHQVGDSVDGVEERYRVSPARFEAQLAALRERGYRSVTLARWHEAIALGAPLHGRLLVLSFDDAYDDFASTAWPRIVEHGFSASLAVVSDEIGGTNRWDDGLLSSRSLLGEAELRELVAAGVEIVSHTAGHRYLPGLEWEEVLAEASRSRLRLEELLGVEVRALAYPFGAETPIVRQLVGASGYRIGLGCRPRRATARDELLRLPRIEIAGDDDLEAFLAKLDT